MKYEDDAVNDEDEVVTESAPLSDVLAIPPDIHNAVVQVLDKEEPTALQGNTEYLPGALYAPKSLHEFFALLYSFEKDADEEPPLGMSAGEFENACESFIAGIFTESIEQGVFPKDSLVASKIDLFVQQLGLPDVPESHEYIARLLRTEYEQKKTPEMLAELRSEVVRALNETQTIEEFEHTLYQELPPLRASYISRRLQHILQGTALHFAEGLDVRGEPAVSQGREWWNDPIAEAYLAKILQEYAPLPFALNSEHLAHLLLDWTFKEEQVTISPNERTPEQLDEASRVVKGMEEFDELRPPKKSEDVFVRKGYLDM